MKTLQFRIIDATLGGDIWSCGDPPHKMERYELTRIIDGHIHDGVENSVLLPEIYGANEFDMARKRVNELNDADFDAYICPDWYKKFWKR